MGKRNTGKGPNPKANMGKMTGAMRREQKKNHGRLPGGKVRLCSTFTLLVRPNTYIGGMFLGELSVVGHPCDSLILADTLWHDITTLSSWLYMLADTT